MKNPNGPNEINDLTPNPKSELEPILCFRLNMIIYLLEISIRFMFDFM